MDAIRYDRSVKSLIPNTEGISRRASLVTLGAAGLAAALARPFVADAKKKRNKKGKRNTKRKNGQKPASPPPAPVTRLDAVCAGPAETVNGVNGDARRAQSFTALSSGSLVMAQLVLTQNAGTDVDYVLRLSPLDGFGFPTNEILAETSVANAAVPVGLSLVTFTFSRPFAVVAGTAYALVLSRPGGGNVFWHLSDGDVCPGQLFASADQTAEFLGGSNLDFIFTTFVSS
jgi:hypothetical protein